MPASFQHRPGCEEIAAYSEAIEKVISDLAAIRVAITHAHEASDHVHSVDVALRIDKEMRGVVIPGLEASSALLAKFVDVRMKACQEVVASGPIVGDRPEGSGRP